MLLGAAASFATSPAWAEWLRDDIVVYIEPPLRAPMAAFGAAFQRIHPGTPRVFAAPPVQMLGLLAHGTQADLLITQTHFMDQASQSGLVVPERRTLWRNRLVVAGRAARAPVQSFDAGALRAALGGGALAVPDATNASTVDGPALLRALGLHVPVQGTASTGDALDMVRAGTTSLAICHSSELPAESGLVAVMALPDAAYPPIIYQAALTKTAWSRNQMALLDDLSGTAPRAHDLGLEPVA